ncbi:MAG TPA: hypothetical protein VLA36_13315 [Longimicrobiales bacterium]|nr:hypothetical protein [Longimicrobiales bacterium]
MTVLFGKRVVLLAAALASAGCYVYTPVRPSDAILDSRVRATVSPRQAAELAPVLRNVTPQVVGTLVERNGDTILLDVPLFGAVPGMSSRPVHNRVSLPLADVTALEARTLSRWRTGAVVASVVAGVATGWVVLGGNDIVGDKPKPGADNAIRIRIPIGIGFR